MKVGVSYESCEKYQKGISKQIEHFIFNSKQKIIFLNLTNVKLDEKKVPNEQNICMIWMIKWIVTELLKRNDNRY